MFRPKLQNSDHTLKSIKRFHLIQSISLHIKIAAQNVLRHNLALLSLARLTETESENSLPTDAFCKKIF